MKRLLGLLISFCLFFVGTTTASQTQPPNLVCYQFGYFDPQQGWVEIWNPIPPADANKPMMATVCGKSERACKRKLKALKAN